MSSIDGPLARAVVWLTRPAGQSAALASAIAAAGGRSLVEPLIAIEAPPEPAWQEARALATDPRGWDLCIYTSQYAVAGAERLGSRPRAAAAVGTATAALVSSSFKLPCIAPLQGSGGAALLLHPALAAASLRGRRVLVYQGMGGQDELASGLAGRGAEVLVARVYQRRALIPALASARFNQPRPTLLSLSSVDITTALIEACKAQDCQWPLTLPQLCWSARIADAAARLGCTGRQGVADDTTPESILTGLIALQREA